MFRKFLGHLSIFFLFFLTGASLTAQHRINIDATLQPEEKSLLISQQVSYKNVSNDVFNEIYFFDWANSFSSKTTDLAKRFAENYNSSFHFEKKENRGRTDSISISENGSIPLEWERTNEVDILKVKLNTPLAPGEVYNLNLQYTVKIPNDKFTRYGVNAQNDYKLQYWYLSPAVYDGEWHIYSNKNTDDLYLTPSQFSITLHAPQEYTVISDLEMENQTVSNHIKTTVLKGENRMKAVLYLEQKPLFETIETDKLTVVTNLQNKKVTPPIKALMVDRIAHFLDENLGEYPFEKMVVSETDYRKSPVYGLNLLPNFISPFPSGFEYDMEQLKTMTRLYLENTLALHPREDYWLIGALQVYLMQEYVDEYYPKMKIIGNLSNWWVIRWAHAASLEFNDQYPLLYLNMARHNIHQPLSTQKDSLLKFNKEIANDYYGGSGLLYLEDYIGEEAYEKSIKQFYAENKLKPTEISKFEEVVSRNTALPVNWFFEDFATSRSTIDFKIKKVEKLGDSLRVTIKNKKESTLPVSLYGLNKKNVVYKTWLPPVDSTTTVTIPAKDIKKLVLNHEGVIPEYNRRNNYKTVNGLLNRPLQFRLFQDVEDPNYNQLFFMPIFEYNLYDGLTAGVKLYNKTVLPKAIHYQLEPQFGFRSKTLIGSAAISYTQQIDSENLYAMRYGFAGSYYSYDKGLFYSRISPYITFAFRNKEMRDNEKQFINLRNVTVHRDDNPNDLDQDPSFNVFNVQYVYSNPNLIDYFTGVVDYQVSSKFSKASMTFEYRKLFLNNRQLNLRLFAGTFLYNKLPPNEDFFDFALDRPTDYMFDHNYYGRSEDSGLFSQQLIIAEGGFKSKLQPAFSNSWMTTLNASTNIWKWIYAYGDVGLVHNQHRGTDAVFDTGVRVSLVADYFELYFPMYSSLGWEPGLDNYDQRIRFIVTLSPSTLLRLFTRRWY